MLAALSERSVHVEADRFFGFIESGYLDPSRPESHEQNVLVMDTVAKAAAGYASGGYFTIVEGIVLPHWFLEPLRDALQAAGHAVAYAVLRPPLEVCLSRADGRDAAIVERYWLELAELGPL